MWLTFATFVGYAVIYTVILKPLTPQNIVIGGASGAMPPVLGWAAMTGDVGPEALILFLIIFLWTPPHFWALALYRVEDYRKSGLPMLPVTHGNEFTRLQILLYTLVLFAACLMPFIYGMSSWLYLAVAHRAEHRLHLATAWRLWRNYSDALARKTFRFSLIHLSVLFAALLLDHYLSSEVPRCTPNALRRPGRWRTAWRLGACSEKKPSFKRPSTSPGPTTPRTSSCPTQRQDPQPEGLPGKAVVVFFGYTQCPDVCPTTMAEMAQAKKLLGATAQAARHVHHRRPGARHARGAEGLHGPTSPRLRGAARHARADSRHWPRTSRSTTRRSTARRRAATPWTTRPASYVYDTQGQLRLYARYGPSSRCSAIRTSPVRSTT
jgi:hypothetical protein